jgi:hypothetical protein
MNIKRTEKLFVAITLLIGFILITVLCSVKILDSEAFSKINYYNKSIITYKGRIYHETIEELDSSELASLNSSLNSASAIVDTGIAIKGMELYDVKNWPYASTVLYLKTKDSKFLEYALSGGP